MNLSSTLNREERSILHFGFGAGIVFSLGIACIAKTAREIVNKSRSN